MQQRVQGTQSFTRIMDLLQHIADRQSPPNLADLVAESGLTRPTVYRLVAVLQAEQMITQTSDKRYKPGLRLVSLARNALADIDIRRVARAELEQLRDATGETVHLAIRSGNELVYIDKIESHETVRMASTIGTRVPFHSTGVGKAFLSALAARDAAALIEQLPLDPVTRFTTTDPGILNRKIDVARSQGFVFDDQENEVGIVCYGAAIVDATGGPIASISVSVPLFRHRDTPDFYCIPLMRHRAAIERQLGHSRST